MQEQLQKVASDAKCTDIVPMESTDALVFKNTDQLPGWAREGNERKCGKCLTPLPTEATETGSLPSGWVAQGRNLTSIQCSNCSSLCVKMSRTGIPMSSFEPFSPLEVAEWYKKAAGLSGKKLKEENHALTLSAKPVSRKPQRAT